MLRSRQGFSFSSFAKRGATVALAAVLAVGSVPAVSLVQAASGQSPALAYAADGDTVTTPDGLQMVVGATYNATASYLNASDPSRESMAGAYLDPTVQVVYNEGTSDYSVTITVVSPDDISNIEYNDVAAVQNGNSYTISGISSITADNTISMLVIPMEEIAAGFGTQSLIVRVNTSTLTLAGGSQGGGEEGTGESGEQGGTGVGEGSGTDEGTVASETRNVSYFVKDSGNSFGGMLPAQLEVSAGANGGYSIDIPIAASTMTMVGNTFKVLQHVDGTNLTEAPSIVQSDGTTVFTIEVDSIEPSATFSITYTVAAMNMIHTWTIIARFFDCTAINDALDAAGAVTDNGTAEYTAVQDALTAAKKVTSDPAATEQELNDTAIALNAAVEAYNAAGDQGSGDEGTDQGGDQGSSDQPSTDGTVTTPDGLQMVPNAAYTAPVSFINTTTGAASMASSFLSPNAQVVYNQTTQNYAVTVSLNAGSEGMISEMSFNGQQATMSGNSFTFNNITSIAQDNTISMRVPMMENLGVSTQSAASVQPAAVSLLARSAVSTLAEVATAAATTTPGVSAIMRIDTTNIALASGGGTGTTTPTTPTMPGTTTNAGTGTVVAADPNATAARFVAGHTYEVPMSIMQANTSTTSMAAQYFGSTAYVRPQENGTLDISFTTNRQDYINSLAYNGTELARSGATYTVNIPYTESDTVLPMAMGIAPMQELGMGTVTADFHFQLTQATDLGTNVTSSPSAASTVPQTGDATSLLALAALAGLAFATGASRLARRRS